MNSCVLLYIGHLENIGFLTYTGLPNIDTVPATHVPLISPLVLTETLKIGDTCQASFHINAVLGRKYCSLFFLK